MGYGYFYTRCWNHDDIAIGCIGRDFEAKSFIVGYCKFSFTSIGSSYLFQPVMVSRF